MLVAILPAPRPGYHSAAPGPRLLGVTLAGLGVDRTLAVAAREKAEVFTGLVQALGRIERVAREDAGIRFAIIWDGLAADDPLVLGESISVNGCCLTVV